MGKLTDKDIRDLQVPEGAKHIQAFDDELPGFGVRKFASGKASLFVKYTIGKQQRRKTLSPWVAGTSRPSARKQPWSWLKPGLARMWSASLEGSAASRQREDARRARRPLP